MEKKSADLIDEDIENIAFVTFLSIIVPWVKFHKV